MRPVARAVLTGSSAGATLTQVETSRPRALIGSKYRVVRELGAGGMGVVVEVEHVEFPRRFALKWIRPDLVSPEAERRFKQEAVVVGGLTHENVVSISDFGRDADGAAFMVMELLDGETLAARLERRGALPVARVVKLVEQVCAGLSAAHARGIVHRDIKPSNLFCATRSDGTEVVKILDFGVAKAVEQPSVTVSASPVGTAYYMAPEQAMSGPVDARTDVYAVGVVAFEALTGGRVPHPGETFPQVMAHLLTKPPLSLAELRPDLPPGLVEIVERALAHEPNERFTSADAFARAIRPFSTTASALDETAPGRSLGALEVDLRCATDVRDASSAGLGRTSDPVAAPRPAWPPRALAAAAALALLGVAWWQARAHGASASVPAPQVAAAPAPPSSSVAPLPAASASAAAPSPPLSADATAEPAPRRPTSPSPVRAAAPARPPVDGPAPTTVTGRRGTTFDTSSPY